MKPSRQRSPNHPGSSSHPGSSPHPANRRRNEKGRAAPTPKKPIQSGGEPEPSWVITHPKGLEPFITKELSDLGYRAHPTLSRPEEIRCTSSRTSAAKLITLRTATAVFRAVSIPVDRPRGITSYEYRDILSRLFDEVFGISPASQFRALRIEAAGNQTPTFQKLGTFFAEMTGLPYRPNDEGADLVLRIRRSRDSAGWEVLVRVTPRPLATRSWRVKNFRGALSAPIAAAMVHIAQPSSDHTVLNLPCGSGSILAELLSMNRVRRAIGIDNADDALEAATANLAPWLKRPSVQLVKGDLCHLPLPSSSASIILSDPPWGEALSNRKSSARLYRRMLQEMHRVLTEDGRLIVISQHREALKEAAASLFQWEHDYTVFQGGFHPSLVVLSKISRSDDAGT